jgi:hypothetical protein
MLLVPTNRRTPGSSAGAQHVMHCVRVALPRGDSEVLAWEDLEPERVNFPASSVPRPWFGSRTGRSPSVGPGSIIEVVAGDRGVRFDTGTRETTEEQTGIPAAAGVWLCLRATVLEPGVWPPPECIPPLTFLRALARVSDRRGDTIVHKPADGKVPEQRTEKWRNDSAFVIFSAPGSRRHDLSWTNS